jgi:hypothetical protein
MDMDSECAAFIAEIRDMPRERMELLLFVGKALACGILASDELERMNASADPCGAVQAWRRRLQATQRARIAWRAA